MLDSLGGRIEQTLDAIEASVASTPRGALAFGTALAAFVVGGGVVTLLVVLALLVALGG